MLRKHITEACAVSVEVSGRKAYALFGCDGTIPLTHSNDRFKTERRSFSQQKRSPNGTEPFQPNRALVLREERKYKGIETMGRKFSQGALYHGFVRCST